MDQPWTAVFCVTLAFLSGARSVRLLYARWNDNRVYMYDTETEKSKALNHSDLFFQSTLDYHFSKGYIYFNGANVIRRSIESNIKDLKIIEKRQAGNFYTGIAVDWISNSVYWSGPKMVVKADLDGNNKITIITKSNLNQLKGLPTLTNFTTFYKIEVDPYERSLFMIVGVTKLFGALLKSDLEGRNLTQITDNKYKSITTFTIDRAHKILYLPVNDDEVIYSTNYDGVVIEQFSVCPKIEWLSPITVYHQNMYLGYGMKGDNETTLLLVEPIASIKCPNEESESQKVIGKRKWVTDMRVYDADVQQSLDVYNSYQRIKQLSCNCKNVIRNSTTGVKLLIGRSNGIIQWQDTDTQETKVIVNDSIVRSLDYHYSKGFVYYTGISIKRQSFNLNIYDLKEIADDRNAYGIAVDWINDNIYWIRSYDVEVVKADLDGNEQTSIITQNALDQLKGLSNINFLYNIELDPYERTLFMIAGSERLKLIGTLVKSDLEGRYLSVVSLKKYKLITTFTIDRLLKTLYIVNTGHHGIYSCRYDGEVIEEFSVCPKMWWIYPFATFRQNVYMAYGYEESNRNNILHFGHLATVKCPIDSVKSDNTILGIKVYSIDVQQPLNVYNSYQPIKQRFGSRDKYS